MNNNENELKITCEIPQAMYFLFGSSLILSHGQRFWKVLSLLDKDAIEKEA